MEPIFLELDEILEIHTDEINLHGGSLGVRDTGLLLSAIAAPRATFGGEYLHTDVFEMAAAYLFHIVQNHPFVDGNKRTGVAAALAFLILNDARIRADKEALKELVWKRAQGLVEKSHISEFFRNSRGA